MFEERYLTDNQLAERYGVHRVTIWRWVKGPNGFPHPVKLAGGCSRWRLSEIERWEAGRAAA